MNGGTLIIALPELAKELHAPLFSLIWVILGYMLARTALVLMVGRFVDMIGRKKLYVGGFALFTVVSLVAGFSTGWDSSSSPAYLWGLPGLS